MDKPVTLVLLLALCAFWQSAQAQESVLSAYAKPLRFATATHVMELRLQALTLAAEGSQAHEVDAESAEEEEDEGPPIPLLALFAGSLSVADAGLLETVESRLDDVHRLAGSEDRSGLEQAVNQARRSLMEARGVLVPDGVAREPAFRAGLIVKLAVSERGFGEGYEEAAGGEVSAYPLAWLTLQRVSTLWDGLEPDLDAASDEVQLALDELNAIMPSAQPPDHFRDPEDAEGAALDLVFALERALGRALVIRGMNPALALMQRQAEQACAAVDKGQSRLALENALASRITYNAYLASTLVTLAPDVAADLREVWSELDTLRRDDGADDTCTALQNAIARAGETFGL